MIKQIGHLSIRIGGPGIKEGIKILADIKKTVGLLGYYFLMSIVKKKFHRIGNTSILSRFRLFSVVKLI